MSFIGYSQDEIQVEIIGGAIVVEYDIITITAGNAISFRITNTGAKSKCANLKVEDITLDPSTGFSVTHNGVPQNIKPDACKNGDKYMDFTITNDSGNCVNSTDVTIHLNGSGGDFEFEFHLSGTPEINVLGGSPYADIANGSTTTTAETGTYFGVVDQGSTVTRNYIITSTGSCPLDVTAISSSLGDFSVETDLILPDSSIDNLPVSIDPGSYVIFSVTFLAPVSSGTLISTISISNSDNTTFTFDVSAEIFDYNIPGPGGITADFRLWLKSTRGVTRDANSKVEKWSDIGTNGKHATQSSTAKRPIYIDDAASNINFNPVIQFENNGGSTNQYLYNSSNGFYSQDIFIVMVPDVDVSSASGMTIFSGSISDIITPENYVDDSDDVTGVGMGDFTSNVTGERLWYNQGSSTTNPYYSLPASSSRAYDVAGIINARNKSATASDGMTILYNSVDDTPVATQTITTFQNVGYVDTAPDPDVTWGTPYKIGINANSNFGNLNGRVAEIFTFAERVSDADRQKIESYLAIKYGITLGASTEAQKNYVNSFDTIIWDITANAGYNYHVTGIGRDSISDLNQKQSKTLNTTNEVTIGLNGIYSTNNANISEFIEDGDFLVWGSNNNAYTGTSTNTVTIASGLTTSLTRIDRKWKIVESKESVNGDVGKVYVSIPVDAFSSFSLGADEEYVLIVADADSFSDTDIIDVIPLESDGNSNLETWYDFDGTKYFTFGRASKLSENHAMHIDSDDYLVGASDLNLNIDAFTISAWVKYSVSSSDPRTIVSKGSKLQLRINTSDQVEVMVDDTVTPKFTSTMQLNDGKWHQITLVYNSGTIFLYVDGVLDKSELNVVAPSLNYNHFSVGALYIDKNTIENPLKGDIDEVYVWDEALTEGQIRYLMNQEISKTGEGLVDGKILPQAVESNEVATLQWSKLKAYYDFNSFYGSTAEGLTDDRNFLRLKYLDKDKDLASNQTAPLPYVSTASGVWGNAGTWLNGADNILPNALSLDGETYIDWNIVETNHDISSGDKDITVLGLINASGTITIADPVVTSPIENNDGQSLRVTHYLEIDGVIDLVGESQLVQDEGSILDADSGGYIERDQQGTANSFNYNYWSSSVSPITGNTGTRGTGVESNNSNYTVSGVLYDGTSSDAYQSIMFEAAKNAADSDTPSDPKTISTRWFYKFYGPHNSYSGWSKINHLSSLQPGEGFTMKGTSGAADLLTNQNYVFKGLPNNGDISLELDKSSGDMERLIGNPYPSAIDADEFILDNIKTTETINGEVGRNSVNVINGALYFWHHFGEINSHRLSDYVGGYATYTLMGGTEAYSTDDRIDNSSPTVGGDKIPERYIPLNQGFFVRTYLPSGISGTTTTVEGGTIVFKNSQRVFVREDSTGINEGSIFFKPSNTKKAITEKPKDTRPKIRLRFISPLGFQRQLLVGADKNATNDFDLGYDAPLADINKDDMYWMLHGGKFVIQGVGGFEANQELPLGLSVNQSGVVSIKIDAIENLDSDLAVYIKDGVTGETHQINNEPYEVYLDVGEYESRFSLVLKPKQVDDEVSPIDDYVVYFDPETSSLIIKPKGQTEVFNVMLYNFFGKRVKTNKVRVNKMTKLKKPKSGIYILRFNAGNRVISKKILIKKQ
ncbi:LamG-like jellyroll fold domain-containing protein [Snuella sedimenti]|uniref:T9SS type A sorting domain-containing protein n=1 Tax=Snuella sedimenti TaxID=2798802 RepID=A0A8J7IN98_9FLAO|nr:LamG-like jellyroll fold domain-containing protein [Snuella sedimenti]MBJ6367842.1 T9SS type A sorting domain-containing protein [Snuella sedimenti]